MGRNKIEIETKKTSYERRTTFDKRKLGLVKKAKELSKLCDAPVMLLFFSPKDEKSYEFFLSDQCNFEEMIQRYAAVPPEERYKSKVEGFKQLKTPFAKQGKIIDVDHELKILRGGQSSAVEDKPNHLYKLQVETEEAQKALGVLRYLDDIDSINDINMLDEIEAALRNAILYNNTRKVHFLCP